MRYKIRSTTLTPRILGKEAVRRSEWVQWPYELPCADRSLTDFAGELRRSHCCGSGRDEGGVLGKSGGIRRELSGVRARIWRDCDCSCGRGGDEKGGSADNLGECDHLCDLVRIVVR